MKKIFKVLLIVASLSFLVSLVIFAYVNNLFGFRMAVAEKIGRLADPCLEFIASDLAGYNSYKIENDRVCYIPYQQEPRFYIKANYPYAEYKTLTGADPETFQEVVRTGYGMDRNHVYYYGEILPLQISKLQSLADREYIADDVKVFFQGKEMREIEAASFELLTGSYYSKDKDTVYYWDTKIENVDVATFTLAHMSFGADARHVFYEGKILDEIDRSSLAFISEDLVKDNKNVFFEDKILPDADSKTFEIISDPDGNQGQYVGYGKDRNNVYYHEKKLEGVDPSSAKIVNTLYIQDKNGCYSARDKIADDNCI